ncbi:hypothetical protein BV22DRAFT_1135374 [Leucogyrophana mollusca]|uniref:Uncharacterized protein n=1 Tax=Leucogyrophana mollusca TaxID=85980 RepID=A0ACB8AWX8_9AGAM|nr:hypothetical protein BV22DRAFT_1135374 [Leucogyrophana mollusca]
MLLEVLDRSFACPPTGFGSSASPQDVSDSPTDNPISRLLVLADNLLQERQTEKAAILKDCSICLTDLAEAERELDFAIEMCNLVRSTSPATVSDSGYHGSDNGHHDSDNGDPVQSVYDDIVATLSADETEKSIKSLQFEAFLKSKATPPPHSMMAVAMAAVEEFCALKFFTKRKVERCWMQYLMHKEEFKEVEAACLAAERAISILCKPDF